MPIFACPKCSQHLSVPDSAAGQTVACPKCGQALSIPASGVQAAPAAPPTSTPAHGILVPGSSSGSRPAADAFRPGAPAQAPSPSATGDTRPPAGIRLPTGILTRLPKPILFALFGAAGALIGAILVELPFYLARPAAAAAPAAKERLAQVDIMFVLDVTGSMQKQIDGVRDGIESFVDGLRKHRLDVRVGLTYFRDRIESHVRGEENIPEDPQALRFNGSVFTDDPEQFRKQVQELKASGGGDLPESSLDALAYASRQPFRGNALRVLLLITDAPPHVPDIEMRSVDQTVDVLKRNRIEFVHLIIKDADRKIYQTFQRDMPGQTFSLDKVASGKQSFDKILPEVSAQVFETAKNRIRSLQSRVEYAEGSGGRLIFAGGLWTAFIAVGLSLALIVGQRLYQNKDWRDWPALTKGLLGLAAGLLGGIISQAIFLAGGGAVWDILGRMLGWGLLGGLVGVGMALFVPNLIWWRGLLGGLVGGLAGVLGFLPISLIMGEVLGRLIGAALLGFCIGLMVALAEMAFRRWWLEVRYGPREIRTVTLGAVPVTVGGDERQATVVVPNAPPIFLRYGLDTDHVWCEEATTGRSVALEPGDAKMIGNVTITVCSAATRRGAGLVLQLSNGKNVPLSEGLPLTKEELPGLAAQSADGTVAIIQRRPSDPKTLLLLNRSRTAWTAVERGAAPRTVTPGMGIPLGVGLRVNFGEVDGLLVRLDK